jgi:hypothetical protein
MAMAGQIWLPLAAAMVGRSPAAAIVGRSPGVAMVVARVEMEEEELPPEEEELLPEEEEEKELLADGRRRWGRKERFFFSRETRSIPCNTEGQGSVLRDATSECCEYWLVLNSIFNSKF